MTECKMTAEEFDQAVIGLLNAMNGELAGKMPVIAGWNVMAAALARSALQLSGEDPDIASDMLYELGALTQQWVETLGRTAKPH